MFGDLKFRPRDFCALTMFSSSIAVLGRRTRARKKTVEIVYGRKLNASFISLVPVV